MFWEREKKKFLFEEKVVFFLEVGRMFINFFSLYYGCFLIVWRLEGYYGRG